MRKIFSLLILLSLFASCIRIEPGGRISIGKNKAYTAEKTEYDTRIREFHAMESMALDIFPLDTTVAGKEKSLSEIKDRGIYYWNENISLLEGLKELELNAEQKAYNKTLKDYCLMQISCYELMYKAINERSKKYDDEITAKMTNIDKFIADNR